ncbi:MAG TPA: tRNA uridine-5-carboxymethylaminomethyl(34) synthesis enzyme MnmG [Phycisphaerae bacterium]|nr:tRNA uridine-5-carboxymethylaminomethyl(34) synthesis enzyme MnmG [Phycisphaerae bacterium]
MAAGFDVIVIGGGHAGAEAAWAAARLGCRTALVTMSLDAIGRMSCNPAIGGLGKGQLVREVDALGGLMARAIDATGIQFRMLNRGKGPAVWSPRAQADRAAYAAEVRRLLESTPNLVLFEGVVEEILAEPEGRGGDSAASEPGTARAMSGPRPAEPGRRVRGVRLADGREFLAGAVVLTTGTFLRGLLHCGEEQTPGGRIGEPPAEGMSRCLEALGLRLGRLKTGTPPRLRRDTIDYARTERQAGDEPPVPFSFMNDRIDRPQIPCWITYTNKASHELIRANLHRAPMYSGQIKSRGPRYCPSIEDKIVRFADKDRHQIFLEPEGMDDPRIYCNGIATSLPKDVQEALVHSISGLEHAEIVQFGYAVEYDWVPTDQIDVTLETRAVKGLFLAGQINGTSGYEEAAAQGLIAGVNAVARVRRTEPLVLGRDEAYIGVMIDDLVTRPPDEPYRMFTSRAEYRLQLRSDNADERLTPIGRRVGLVDDERWRRFDRKREQIAAIERWLGELRRGGVALREWLRRPEVRIRDLAGEFGLSEKDLLPEALDQVEIRTKYDGYIARQVREIDRFRQTESLRIPDGFDFSAIPSLRAEAKEKLCRFQPRTLGQASRLSGISPADLAVLHLYLYGACRTSGR